MPDFPIDPELRIRATPPIVLRRTTEAVDFIRKVALSSPDHAWQDVLQGFEEARDEWKPSSISSSCLKREAYWLREQLTFLALGKIGLAARRPRFALRLA